MDYLKSFFKFLGVVIFLIGLVYGGLTGLYISSMFFFIILYLFGYTKRIEDKMNLKVNNISNIFRLVGLVFIYFSLYETDIKIYNIITAIICTLLLWLFILYLNLDKEDKKVSIDENINIIKKKYSNYKNPSITLLNDEKDVIEESKQEKNISKIFKDMKVKAKFKDSYHNIWLSSYKYEIESGTKIDSVLEIKKDLEVKLESKIEIELSENEKNIIYVKVPSGNNEEIHLKGIINKDDKELLPLGVTDYNNSYYFNLFENAPVLLIGKVGSGKTNLLHVFINGLLLKYKPTELNMILIDKKQTSFDVYEGLPHLVLPVLNNPNKVSHYLDLIIEEIDRRKMEQDNSNPIVVIIDEVFDISMDFDILKNKLSSIISEGSKHKVYLIISTSIVTEDVLTDYLYYNIKNHINFYGNSKEKYDEFVNDISSTNGLINFDNIRIKNAKIEKEEIKRITDFAKGLK